MRSTLSPMFMTLACVTAFTIAQPEILETSSDAGPSEAISNVAGISRLQEAGMLTYTGPAEPQIREVPEKKFYIGQVCIDAIEISEQILKKEKNYATMPLLDLITMEMKEKITRLFISESTEDLPVDRRDNPDYYRDQNNLITQVMAIVKEMVVVTIKPNPDSTEEGIQQIDQLFENLNMLLTKWRLPIKDIELLIGLVKDYTSSGKIQPLGLYDNKVKRQRKLYGRNVLDSTSFPESLRVVTTPFFAGARASRGVGVQVIRNGGQVNIIPETELVPEDIIMVTDGQIIPADCRVIWSKGLKVDEFSLARVSEHLKKSADDVSEKMPNGCYTYKNLIMKGTTVTGGEALAIVFGIGVDTRKGLYLTQLIMVGWFSLGLP